MRGSKDAAIGLAVRTYVNARLTAIGRVTQLSVDTAERRARVRLTLRGESDPIELDVREYALDRSEGQDWLTLLDAVASREWLTAVLEQGAIGRPFPVSATAATALRLLA